MSYSVVENFGPREGANLNRKLLVRNLYICKVEKEMDFEEVCMIEVDMSHSNTYFWMWNVWYSSRTSTSNVYTDQ